jgi:hypothetical protein
MSSCARIFFILLLCWMGLHCGIYKCSYDTSNISYFNSSPPLFSFITSPPISGTVSTSIFFPFTFMCTQYLCHIHSLTSFPYLLLPHSLVWTTPGRTCSSLLFSDFAKERKVNDFCLFNTQGDFLMALQFTYIL